MTFKWYVHVHVKYGNFIMHTNFRLELAVMQMMKSLTQAANVMKIMHLIYKTYHYSPKIKRELKKIGEKLGVNVCNPTRVKGTSTWSSFKATKSRRA